MRKYCKCKKKKKKLASKLGIQTYQNLTNDDEACISSLFSIILGFIDLGDKLHVNYIG